VPSLVAAPLGAGLLVVLAAAALAVDAWPWWWTGVLALAWAPLLWLPAAASPEAPSAARRLLTGGAMVGGLALAALAGHAVPFGIADAPDALAGPVALLGMAALYASLAVLQARPQALANWRRWSYAGFYVDEFTTRATLRLWPTRWVPAARP
jgi:NAD(P)H-quinone oxidoreductase subunit 5